MKKHIDATPESGKDFYINFHDKGEIVMLNLLKFKDIADYSNLAPIPTTKTSGKEAFKLYLSATNKQLKEFGSEIIFYGASNSFLIGPEHEKWDAVLLVKHKSVLKFMEFAKTDAYLNNVIHRSAALEDSRLLPISEYLNSPFF